MPIVLSHKSNPCLTFGGLRVYPAGILNKPKSLCSFCVSYSLNRNLTTLNEIEISHRLLHVIISDF